MKMMKRMMMMAVAGMAFAAQAELLSFKATSFNWDSPNKFDVARMGVAKNGVTNWNEGACVYLDLKLTTEATTTAKFVLADASRDFAGPAWADVSAYKSGDYTFYVELWDASGAEPTLVAGYAPGKAKDYAQLKAASHVWIEGASMQSVTPWEVPEAVSCPEHATYTIEYGTTTVTVKFITDPGYAFADGATEKSFIVDRTGGSAPTCPAIYYAGPLYFGFSTSGWNLYTDEALTTVYGDYGETWSVTNGTLVMDGFVHPGQFLTVPEDAALKFKGEGSLVLVTNDASVAVLKAGSANDVWVKVQGANPAGATPGDVTWNETLRTYAVAGVPAQKLVFTARPTNDLTVEKTAHVKEIHVYLPDGEEIPRNPDGTYSVPDGAETRVVFVAEDGTFFGGTDPTYEIADLVSTDPFVIPEELLPPDPIVHTHCVCGQTGCDGTGHDTNQVWTCTATLPTSAGYWVLTNDLAVSSVWTPADGTFLCLCGRTIHHTTPGGLVIDATGVGFTLTDCQGGAGRLEGAMTGGTIRNGTVAGPVTNGTVITGGFFEGVVTNATIYGGTFKKTVSGGTVNGGLFANGVLQPNVTIATGYSKVVGTEWTLIGKDVTLIGGRVISGTFTFDPRDPQYQESGLFNLDGATVTEDPTAVPPTYTVVAPAIVYVSETGSDVLGDGSAAKPYSTLTNAYAKLPAAGGTIALIGDVTAKTGSDPALIAGTATKAVVVTSAKADGTLVENDLGDETDLAVLKRGGNTAALIKVTAGSVVFRNVVLDGEALSVANPLVSVTGGTVTNEVNAILRNAKSTGNGGAIAVAGGKVTIEEGKYENNQAANGSVFSVSSGSLTVLGGSFGVQGGSNSYYYRTGGTATIDGGVYDAQPSTKMTGVSFGSSCSEAQIGTKWIVWRCVRVEDGKIVQGSFTFDPTDPAYEEQGIVFADGLARVADQDGNLVLDTPHVHCLCCGTGVEGHECELVMWTPWSITNALPAVAGNWYLMDNVTLAATQTPADGVELCFNGRTVNVNGQALAITSDGVLKLTNCGEGSAFTGGTVTLSSGSIETYCLELPSIGGAGTIVVADGVTNTVCHGTFAPGMLVLGTNAYLRMASDFTMSDPVTVVMAESLDEVGILRAFVPAEGVSFTAEELWALAAKVVPYDPARQGRRAAVDMFASAIWLSRRIVISYDGMGGTWDAGVGVSNCVTAFEGGYVYPDVIPNRAGYMFNGWFAGWTNGADQVVFGGELPTYQDHTVYAHWVSLAVEPGEIATKLVTEDVTGGIKVTGAPDDQEFADGALDFPDLTSDAVDAKPLVAIGDYAFNAKRYDRKHPANPLVRVSIPTYVTEIGSYAFSGCTSLTCIAFAPTRDYTTGEKVPLVIRDWAFRGSTVTEVRFPAGSSVVLDEGAFGYSENITDIYLDGDVEVMKNARPFQSAGKKSGTVTIHLSPTLAADAAYVLSLTNGMNAARVKLSQEIEGKCEIVGTPSITTDPMVFTFSVASSAPWLTVNTSTVYLFYSTTLQAGPYIGNEPLYASEVVRNDDGTYTAKFAKPASAGTMFFQLCVGDPR